MRRIDDDSLSVRKSAAPRNTRQSAIQRAWRSSRSMPRRAVRHAVRCGVGIMMKSRTRLWRKCSVTLCSSVRTVDVIEHVSLTCRHQSRSALRKGRHCLWVTAPSRSVCFWHFGQATFALPYPPIQSKRSGGQMRISKKPRSPRSYVDSAVIRRIFHRPFWSRRSS